MSITRHCDCCNKPIDQHVKATHATIKTPDGKHLANVTLTMNTRTGAEHVCFACQVEAISGAVSGA